MRRSPMPLAVLLLLPALLGGLVVPAAARQEATPVVVTDQAATPPAALGGELPAGIEVELLGQAEVEDADAQVVLTRITLDPGADAEMHDHTGAGVLYVQEGTICYRQGGAEGDTVVVNIGSGAAPSGLACNPPEGSCDGDGGCEVGPDEVVLLRAGDSVEQSFPLDHAYENVGDDQAVLLISEVQPGDGAGCSGGCY